VRSAVDRGDLDTAKAFVHRLKGASATMGASGVASACALVEWAAARGRPLQEELASLASELDRVLAALRAEAASTVAGPSP
jgi:HPt (histidine-containing phosphotransfer) domain-containing protein